MEEQKVEQKENPSPEPIAPPQSNKSKVNFLSYFKKPITPLRALIIIIAFILVAGSITSLMMLSQPKKPAPSPTITQPLILSLESPFEDAVVLGEKITVKGTTLPNKVVFFYTETDVNSVESDQNGRFEGEIALGSGINTLTVTAFGDNGEEKTEILTLVYDDQVMGVKEPPGQAKKEEVTQKATIGNIDQVKPNSVVVDEKKAKKKTEVTFDKNTKIINQDKKVLKPSALKNKDLAAIISTESGKTKEKKIVKMFIREASSSAELKQQKRHAVSGVIINISGETITIAHQIQRERTWTLQVTAQTVIKIKGIEGATLVDLAVGQRIAAVGDRNDEGILVAKRIHVIPGKATGVFEKQPLATPSGTLTGTPTSTPSATPTEEISPTPTATESASPTP